VILNKGEIQEVASIAKGRINAILAQWLPGGKREGDEYLPLNPNRADSKPGSFSINIRTGAWSDFATDDKGGDMVALVAYLDGVSQGEAAKTLAGFLGVDLDKKTSLKLVSGSQGNTPKGKPDDELGQCIMPAPDDAPAPPVGHRKYGKPTHRYAYRSIAGAVCFYHDRYEFTGGKKEFRPLSLWKKNGVLMWQFIAPKGVAIPPYGLPGLLEYPDAPVWLVEGEKAAIALSKLHPLHPVLTWQGGSNGVTKADYTALSGRDCLIFRDNDNPGLKAQQKLIAQLQAAGVASLKVLAVDELALKPGWEGEGESESRKATLSEGDAFVSKGDAADLVALGWQAEHFTLFLERDGVLSNVDLSEAMTKNSTGKKGSDTQQDKAVQRQFESMDDGVYAVEQGKDGSWSRRYICAPLEVLGRVRDVDSKGWGKLLKFRDHDNREKRIFIPMRDFGGEGIGIRSLLLDEGLDIARRCGRDVLDYLQSVDSKERIRAAHRAGWHGRGDELAFIYDDSVIGGGDEKWINICPPEEKLFTSSGKLAQWRNNVSALCVGNNLLMVAVSAAFSAPLLHIVGEESGGIHFRGGSSSGKTTLLRVAASVMGGSNYMTQWNASSTAVENLAESHCDALLILDELKQVDPRMAEDITYMVGNGTGKSRGRPERGNRPLAKWRVGLMSSGEISLAQHVEASGKSINAGAEVRLCDIPVDAGVGMGAFEDIHGYESPGAFADALAVNAAKYYGTAFPEFIKQLLDHQDDVRAKWPGFLDRFLKSVLQKNASGQARRIGTRFALFAFAGELATNWDITGWQPGEALSAVKTGFIVSIESFGGQGNKERRDIIQKIRMFLQKNGESRFANLTRSIARDSHAPSTPNKCGYREKVGGEAEPDSGYENSEEFNYGSFDYLCYEGAFEREICEGIDHKQASRLLKELGHLKTDNDGRLKYKVSLPGEGRVRVYCIQSSIFEGEND